MSKIKQLISQIDRKYSKGEFDKFISEVTFPRFKNFAEGTKITFGFPVALIVGANGGGKTSILHAAWGMPQGFSTSRFWFSTAVDPIEFGRKSTNRYWYRHYVKDLGSSVESRKSSGGKRRGYWEPTKAAPGEGMQAMPAKNAKNAPFMSGTADRWTATSRTPHYFNPKAEHSAFDRFFHWYAGESLDERQERFVRYSRKLKEVVDGRLASLHFYGTERILEHFDLSAQQLAAVNRILSKTYVSARYVKHKLYDKSSFSPSVIFKTAGRSYSECFAGSGELAVVNFVLALEGIQKFDLLLLDEPETSLHPGAQEKLLEYILEVVNEKLIQVLISTHSPTFVHLLPRGALIVLDETPAGVTTRLAPTKAAAFSTLGEVDRTVVNLLAEDALMKAIVDRAVGRLDRRVRRKLKVISSSLGVSEMLSNQVRAYIQSNADVIMIVDGDQAEVANVFSKDTDALSTRDRVALISQLKKLGVSIVGGDESFDSWMSWCKSNVIVFERICPEQVLLELLNPGHPLLRDPAATNQKFKDAVRQNLKESGNEYGPSAQATILKMKLGLLKKGDSVDHVLKNLSDRIAEMIEIREKAE